MCERVLINLQSFASSLETWIWSVNYNFQVNWSVRPIFHQIPSDFMKKAKVETLFTPLIEKFCNLHYSFCTVSAMTTVYGVVNIAYSALQMIHHHVSLILAMDQHYILASWFWEGVHLVCICWPLMDVHRSIWPNVWYVWNQNLWDGWGGVGLGGRHSRISAKTWVR